MMTMNDSDKRGLLEAAAILIASPDAKELYDSLEAVATVAYRAPVRLVSKAAVLNPLLDLRVAEPITFRRVMDLVDAKRSALGETPLRPPLTKDGYDKTSYMRDFMFEKRVRERRAAEIENLRRPARDRLMGNARLEFMRQASKQWKKLRDEALAKAQAAAGKPLSREEVRAVLTQFWNKIDSELERQHGEATRLRR